MFYTPDSSESDSSEPSVNSGLANDIIQGKKRLRPKPISTVESSIIDSILLMLQDFEPSSHVDTIERKLKELKSRLT